MKPVLYAWWGWGVCVALLVLQCQARPSPGSDSESWRPITGHRVNRPLFRDDEGQRERKSQDVKEKVGGVSTEAANEARASPTSPTPIGESLKMVTKQLLQSPQATDMVATDVRTPPKIKTHITTEEFVPLGKGEAIPLDPDNTHSYQVTNTQHVKVSTAESTPASGISTWILLNGSEQSTQASQKKQPTKPLSVVSTPVPLKKKQPKPTQETSKPTYEALKNNTPVKVENKQAATITKVDNPKKTQSVNQEPLVKIPAVMLQDAKFKNKTPVIVGKVPSSASTKNKSEVVATFKKGNATIVPVNPGKVEALAPQSVRRKVTVVPTTSTTAATTLQTSKPHYQYEMVPTTSVVVHTDIVEAETTEEVGTTELPTTTTKRTRKPGTKKKKKNKNRRRRPAKKPEGVVESKVTEENNSTRIAPNGSRPLSTRIYNYLSREIMPSVGVGIVGLVLTAGLAGLLLYPFGGPVAARRTYEKTPGTTSDGHMYYNAYNDYNTNGEVDNGQAEETVFGQVLAGMQQSESKYEKYPRPATSGAAPTSSAHYSAQSKYRYDPSHEYGYQSSYQNKDKYSSSSDVSTAMGRNPEGYSTLPDSASLSSKYSPSYSVSSTGSQYSAPSASYAITQYGDPKYSASISASGYGDTKYSSAVDSTSGVGSVQYDSKYSTSVDSTGSSDGTKYSTGSSDGTKYSTLTGLSVEPQSSKYTSTSDDQSVKYTQGTKYTSLTEDQDNKYQSPTYTSITDGQSTKYTSMTENQGKYTSITDNQSGKYSMTDSQGKYPTSAEYTAYSNPSDIGTQKGSYSSNHKQTTYTDIEYDDTKSLPSITEEDKSDKSQPTFSALHSADDSYSNIDSMSMFSGSYNNEVRHRQGVLAVEHGPRSIKLDRQKRQIDTKQNEVDGSLTDETTTSESATETQTEKTTEEPKNASPSHENSVESTTWSMPKETESTTKLPPSREHTFFGFLRRIAEMKLRMGLELLRSTTHAVARYLDDVQKRMENVVREMDKKTDRHRRDLFKKMI
ncbi:mucin-5AC-like [Macrosteles quadrilineatus]|uniref:mucin-5AC-like n=1 Tax=Macrosteles quadrilineatus TaxID=74068 RepID=UPI0023E324AE|nr:mucin-5AC-like [Macrosteles quadrilineatus]XP_054261803.1 mucin-5AC-like [Macrosteles quadrilineatus]